MKASNQYQSIFATRPSIIFKELLGCNDEMIALQGGTSSGKTYNVIMYLIYEAYNEKLRIQVTGESYADLQQGALADIQSIIEDSPPLKKLIKENKRANNHTFTFSHNGSVIFFRCPENATKARHGKRDILFANEANNMLYECFEPMAIRTKRKVIIDYNSDNRFWAHDLIERKEMRRFRSWYEHNEYLPQNLIDRIKAKEQSDPEWFRVYGKGLTGKIQGQIFPDVTVCSEFPPELDSINKRYGMDFGMRDPTTLVESCEYDLRLWHKLLIYESGLVNVPVNGGEFTVEVGSIADRILATELRNIIIWCDSASPSTIAALNSYGGLVRRGILFVAASKPKDSIDAGIKFLKSYRQNIRAIDKELVQEWQLYKYNEKTNKPDDKNNHCWDAIRYAYSDLINNESYGYA